MARKSTGGKAPRKQLATKFLNQVWRIQIEYSNFWKL